MAYDTRPFKVQAAHWLGMAVVCGPIGVIAASAMVLSDMHNGHSYTAFDLRIIIIALLVTAFFTPIVATISGAANKRFDLGAPDFGQFLKGLIMAPVWLGLYAVAVGFTAFFTTALIRAIRG